MERFKKSIDSRSRRLFSFGLLGCALALLLPARAAQAVTKTWNNPAGGSWTEAAKWTPAGVPTTGDDVVLPDLGGANYTVSYSVATASAVALNSVTIGGASGTQTLRETAGGVTLNSNTITVNSNGRLDTSAIVTGSGPIDVNSGGVFRIQSGTISAGGDITIASGGTLTLDNTSRAINRNLINNGTANWSAGNINAASGVTFTNNATLNISAAAQLARSGTIGSINFTNTGTVNNSGSPTLASVITVNSGTLNLNGGIFRVSQGSFTQTAGLTNLNGGGMTTGATLDYSGGSLVSNGTSTITGSVNNTGATINLDRCLNITANYTQGAGGTLVIDVNGDTVCDTHDRLSVGLRATLAGNITVNANASALDTGSAVSIVTYGTRSGTFANLANNAEIDLGSGEFLRAAYGATSLSLTDIQLSATITVPSNGAFVNAPARIRGTLSIDNGVSPTGVGFSTVSVRVREVESNKFWNGTSFVSDPSASIPALYDGPTGTFGTNNGPGTQAVTDGNTYEIAAIVTTPGGTSLTSSTVTVKVDKTRPTLTLDNGPANSSTITALDSPLVGTAADIAGVNPSGLVSVKGQLRRLSDGRYWNADSMSWTVGVFLINASLSGGPGTFGYEIPGLPSPPDLTDGSYTLVVAAYDAANNNGSITRSFKVDNSAPSAPTFTKVGDVINPTDGAVVTALAPIQGTATDAVGVQSVSLKIQRDSDGFYWNGSAWEDMEVSILTSYQPLNGKWERNNGLPLAATNTLSDGDYIITATATDRSGNSTSSTITVTVGEPTREEEPDFKILNSREDEPSK